MTAPLITPSPYLRDHLLTAARNLRADGETARLNLAQAEQDVAEARELLREAEEQERRARAEVDGIARGVEWLEREARQLGEQIDADPAAKLAETGLMHEEPKQVVDLAPFLGEDVVIRTFGGHEIAGHLEANGAVAARVRQPNGQDCYVSPDTIAEIQRVAEIDPPPGFDPSIPLVVTHDGDAPPVARTPDEVIAALTPPPVPHEPAGRVVATHGPGTTGPLDPNVTSPDAGLAHPVPNPPGPQPTDPPAQDGPRHAKKSGRWTGGWPVVGRKKHNEQDGDA